MPSILFSLLKNQLRRLDDFFAPLSVRSSDVNVFAKMLFETNVDGLGAVSTHKNTMPLYSAHTQSETPSRWDNLENTPWKST